MYKSLGIRNYLNFSKMMLDNYTLLGLNESEAIILAKLYDKKQEDAQINLELLTNETQLSKSKITTIISSLNRKGFIELVLVNNNGVLSECYTLDKTYNKFEELYKNEFDKQMIYELVEKTFNKALSSTDIKTISEFSYSYDAVRKGLIVCLENNVLNVKYLKKVLENGQK